METYSGRAGIQQRVLPAYRAPFYDALAEACLGGLSVFAGQALPEERIQTTDRLETARYTPAQNRNIFPIRSPFYQCYQENILEWLEEWQPDVLIVEANARYPSTRLAVEWMHRRSRPVLGWGLGEPAPKGRLAHLRRRERVRFLHSLDGMIAYSQRGAQEYQALGFAPQQVFIAPNAATRRPQGLPSERPQQFDGAPVALFVGRLQKRKRIDSLLQACAALPEALRPRLWIVGDGPERAELEAVAHRYYPAAAFLGDRRGADLDGIFNRADLFVLPGTGGLAVQQAMAHGLPVIVAEGDGTQDDLVTPETGWRLPPGDQPALQRALQEALADAARLRRMGAEAFRMVQDGVNIESMAQAFVRALRSAAYHK